MADIDRRRADAAKAVLARPQAEVDVFEIAAMKILAELADRVEAGARHIKAKADAARNVDDAARLRVAATASIFTNSAGEASGLKILGAGKLVNSPWLDNGVTVPISAEE